MEHDENIRKIQWIPELPQHQQRVAVGRTEEMATIIGFLFVVGMFKYKRVNLVEVIFQSLFQQIPFIRILRIPKQIGHVTHQTNLIKLRLTQKIIFLHI